MLKSALLDSNGNKKSRTTGNNAKISIEHHIQHVVFPNIHPFQYRSDSMLLNFSDLIYVNVMKLTKIKFNWFFNWYWLRNWLNLGSVAQQTEFSVFSWNCKYQLKLKKMRHFMWHRKFSRQDPHYLPLIIICQWDNILLLETKLNSFQRGWFRKQIQSLVAVFNVYFTSCRRNFSE